MVQFKVYSLLFDDGQVKKLPSENQSFIFAAYLAAKTTQVVAIIEELYETQPDGSVVKLPFPYNYYAIDLNLIDLQAIMDNADIEEDQYIPITREALDMWGQNFDSNLVKKKTPEQVMADIFREALQAGENKVIYSDPEKDRRLRLIVWDAEAISTDDFLERFEDERNQQLIAENKICFFILFHITEKNQREKLIGIDLREICYLEIISREEAYLRSEK